MFKNILAYMFNGGRDLFQTRMHELVSFVTKS